MQCLQYFIHITNSRTLNFRGGGPEEQAAEIEAGNLDAKDWHDEAKKIVERTVSYLFLNMKYHADLNKDVSVL